jgi:hypothetical protein
MVGSKTRGSILYAQFLKWMNGGAQFRYLESHLKTRIIEIVTVAARVRVL